MVARPRRDVFFLGPDNSPVGAVVIISGAVTLLGLLKANPMSLPSEKDAMRVRRSQSKHEGGSYVVE